MKQCPNPNCILYTRIEELPDAYVRCPGCGGELVESGLASGALASGVLSRPFVTPQPLPEDLDEEYADGDLFEEYEDDPALGGPYAGAGAQMSGPLASGPLYEPSGAYGGYRRGSMPIAAPQALPPDEGEYDEVYYPYGEGADDASVTATPRLSTAARFAYAGGALLLLTSCILFFFVLTTRILPQQRVVGPAQATETAVSALRPAVNTPISVMPTAPSSGGVAPTQAPLPTLPVAPPSGQEPPREPAPPATQPAEPPVAATAPPAQADPEAGVLDAFMTSGIEGGEPAGRVDGYGASEPFVLAVQAQFGPGGVTSASTRWYGPDGLLLYEMPRRFELSGVYYTAFTLKKSGPWQPGSYRVDVHTNGSAAPAYSLTFGVGE